jgi:predicted phage terminase large subunit-like protein
MVETYSPQECLIDDDNASKVYMQLLSQMARDQNIPVPWKPLPMRGQDKETRAAPLRGMFKRKKIFIKRAPWTSWLVGELLKFPNALGSGVDDGVDALSLLGRRLSVLVGAAPAPAAKPPVKTWQDMTLNEMWTDREKQVGHRRRV